MNRNKLISTWKTEALREAGFATVEVLKNWGPTYTIKAKR